MARVKSLLENTWYVVFIKFNTYPKIIENYNLSLSKCKKFYTFLKMKLFLAIVTLTYIHTYLIDHYNPSVRNMDLVSHTTYVCGTYSLKSIQNHRFFLEVFIGILFAVKVFDRNLLRESHRRIIFFFFHIFVLMPHLGFKPWP